MVLVIGITGKIACGKTSVGQMLLKLGAERYIDADAVVHRLYDAGQPVAVRVRDLFGPQVLASDGSVDRRRLGAIVFQDTSAMQRLEQIVHPAVSEALHHELTFVHAHGIAVIDAVKLLEGSSSALCHARWLITCPTMLELERLMARNHLDRSEAQARLHAQPDFTRWMNLVDEVIDNGGSLEQTSAQVTAAFERFHQKFVVEHIL